MKKIFTSLLLLLCCVGIYGQIKFEPLTYEEALQKAKKKKKILFVQLQSPTCDQCNEVGTKGLSSSDVSDLLKKEFIAVTFKATDPDWKVLSRQYFLSFGSLFFNSSGDLLHKYTGTSSSSLTYVNEIKKATEKNYDYAYFQNLEEDYKKGERSLEKIKELILYKIKFNQSHDQLTTIYLSLLPDDSLYTSNNVAFLIKTSPLLTSRADSVMRKNQIIFDSCWNTNPLAERIRINQLIINKSRMHAIITKNSSFAYKVAAFTRSTYTTNIDEGIKAGEKQILYFYLGVKDTFRIYAHARAYADRFLMNQSKEDIKRNDSLELVRLFAETKSIVEKTTGGSVVTKKTVAHPTVGSKISAELREISLMMLNSTKDPVKLEKTLTYINRAIELNEDGNSYEDKAKVLQKLNRIDEAIKTLEFALDRFRSRGLSADWLIPKIEALKKGAFLNQDTNN
ncbi:thioredoxin family protein [Lacibacter sp. H375]|uniref:thioredoxin family protein n=1 Tax=Lacibacter sp. H375 TaxID=3133424 RepID=UPI0030C64661